MSISNLTNAFQSIGHSRPKRAGKLRRNFFRLGIILVVSSNLSSPAFADFSSIPDNLKQQQAAATRVEETQANIVKKVKTFMDARKLYFDFSRQFMQEFQSNPRENMSTLEYTFGLVKAARNDLVSELGLYKNANDALIEIKRIYWIISTDLIADSLGLKTQTAREAVRQDGLSRWRKSDQLPLEETYQSTVILLEPLLKDFDDADRSFGELMEKARLAANLAETQAKAKATAEIAAAQAEADAAAQAAEALADKQKANASVKVNTTTATKAKVKLKTIICQRGTVTKKVTGNAPKCPAGFRKK